MSQLRGAGHFVPWDGGCLLIGRAHDLTPLHAHYALQIGVGRTTGICFRPTDEAPWTAYDVAIIPSRQPHAMDATRVIANAVLFIEPETRAGRAISEQYLQGGICDVEQASLRTCANALFSAWDTRGLSAVTRAAGDLISALTGGIAPATVTDPRVLRAIVYINAHLTEQVTLDEAAAEACLSSSRFRHLFIEETGMAFRPFVLWRRFLRAWELIGGGAAISTAAHAAGFADAAHFTRTSRQMFGFPPSALEFAVPLTDDDTTPKLRS
jgi:AraC-like DNA-binding protein